MYAYLRISAVMALLALLPTCGGGGGGGGGTDPVASLQLTAVMPADGREMGGTELTLTGVGFEGAGPNTVTVGGVEAIDVVTLDDTHLLCRTVPLPLGLLDLSLTNDRGTAVLPDAFTCRSDWPADEVKVNEDAAPGWNSQEPAICAEGRTVYAVWQDDRDGENDIYFNHSDDGGTSWQATDSRLDSDLPGENRSLYPQICSSGPFVYVVWFDRRNGDYDVYFNRSLDGGTTWLAQDVRLDTDEAGIADSSNPVICCNGDRVYVAWVDRRGSGEDIYFNRSLDRGSTWLAADVRVDRDTVTPASSYSPQIGCEGDLVFLTWQDRRDGEGDIYFSRSTDAGATWLAEDIRLDTTPAGSSNSYSPRIAGQGADLYVVWADRRFQTTDYQSVICMNRSADGGLTWLPADVRIDTGTPLGVVSADGPTVAVDGDLVYVAWYDDRNNPGGDERDIFLNRSTDRGVTWQASDTRLDSSLPGERGSFYPKICCGRGGIFVAWEDQRSPVVGTTLYANWSMDAGVTWRDTDFRMDTRTGPTATSGETWGLACDEGSIYVAWADDREGDRDLWMRSSHP